MKRERLRICGKTVKVDFMIVWMLVACGVTAFVLIQYNTIFVNRNLNRSKSSLSPEPIHLVAVSCGRQDYQGKRDIKKPMDLTLTMVKSAVLFAKKSLRVHIFTEEDMVSKFEAELQSWPENIQKKIEISLNIINYEMYLSPEMGENWKKWYKTCGSYRLLVPMILKDNTPCAIYSDSDVIFIKPIDDLWALMNDFNERQVVAISPTAGHPLGGTKNNENFIQHSTGLFQINSGVMLMNFNRMLNSDWSLFHDEKKVKSDDIIPHKKYGIDLLLTYYQEFGNTAEHDQKLLNILFHFNPGLIKQLPCSWNFKNNFCLDGNNVCEDAEHGDGAGAVHGITSVFFNDENPTFRTLYEAFLKYKFEEDVEESLLKPFIKQLQRRAKHTFCGMKSHVIIQPLKKSIISLTKNS